MRYGVTATMMAVGVFVLAGGASAAQSGPEVRTATGTVRGQIEDGVASWKGVPFAAAPVAANRWRAPQPPTPWTGVRDAGSFASDCMQEPFPYDSAPIRTKPSEDCLYLNVWRPAVAPAGGRLPVLVWIHGGGFVNGGASPVIHSGDALARKGIVVVSVNYRLGRFGTFAHPQLTREEGSGPHANYGHMDQIAALKWVQRNIARFGGDPANVTIMGESAGGISVNALVTSPLAKGLFARGVAMSGGDGTPLDDAAPVGAPGSRNGILLPGVERIGVAFAKSRGIAADDPQALAKLRALSAEEVTGGLNLMAFVTPGERTFASPFRDGQLVVDGPAAVGSGRFQHVPMIIGATSADIGDKTGYMIAGARRWSRALTAKGVPVHYYRFSYVAESIAKPGADHASDVSYFLGNVRAKYGDKTTERDVRAADTIDRYIVNFVRNGNPNGPGLPTWPAYAASTDEVMDFAADGNAVAAKDPWAAEMDAVAGAPTR